MLCALIPILEFNLFIILLLVFFGVCFYGPISALNHAFKENRYQPELSQQFELIIKVAINFYVETITCSVTWDLRDNMQLQMTSALNFVIFLFFYATTCTYTCKCVHRRLPGRRALVVVFIKNMLFEIIAFVVFECL